MTTRIRDTHTVTRLLPAAVLAVVALLAFSGPAAAAPAATQTATSTCWLDVVNDWLAHQPNVTGTYPVACYTQAIQHLNAYPDVQNYSSAMDDIHRALLAAIHQERGTGGGSGSGGVSPGPGPSGNGGGSGGSGGSGSGTGSGTGFFRSLADRIGPGNAQSIPLPLLVLGALALLLLLAAGATWLTRRMQARRVTPATAPAQAPPQQRR